MSAWRARKRRLWDAYVFPDFRPEATVRGIFGDPKARIIRLRRRSKKRGALVAVASIRAGMTVRSVAYVISRAAILAYFSSSKCGACAVGRVAK
jgi:hypothetical protein